MSINAPSGFPVLAQSRHQEDAMEINATPLYDQSVNTTGCCPKFNPDGWDRQDLHFRKKTFVRAHTMSAMHIPINMGRVFSRVQKHLDANDAMDPQRVLVLSRDLSPWSAEHLFATTKDVPEEEVVTISGDFLTKVFEGPYQEARNWYGEMKDLARAEGRQPGEVWFFYTTCPKCAKAYGKNYVVGLIETQEARDI
jgi:hypothetical protein